MRNYYKVLEISEEANNQEILDAYKRLINEYQPEHNPDYKLASQMYALIDEAYGVLSDPFKRKEYDMSLKRHSTRTKTNMTTGNSKGETTKMLRVSTQTIYTRGKPKYAGWLKYGILTLLLLAGVLVWEYHFKAEYSQGIESLVAIIGKLFGAAGS